MSSFIMLPRIENCNGGSMPASASGPQVRYPFLPDSFHARKGKEREGKDALKSYKPKPYFP